MFGNKEYAYWDVIIKVTDLESQTSKYQTYTQASEVTVSENNMRRNVRQWVKELNKQPRLFEYQLEKMGPSGSLDAEITRLLSQGMVESANHTIRL